MQDPHGAHEQEPLPWCREQGDVIAGADPGEVAQAQWDEDVVSGVYPVWTSRVQAEGDRVAEQLRSCGVAGFPGECAQQSAGRDATGVVDRRGGEQEFLTGGQRG
ncbi:MULTISPECIES: hypothetical protein [Actinosynnema]|uniref:hypothetical protein n=1 Tax=Actinosynnema TaxID=40566 RepID=UPI0031DFA4EC